MKGKRKIGVKYIVAAALIVFFSVCYLFDFLWSKTYKVEIVSVSDYEPPADSTLRVEIVVRVTHFGKAAEGHELFALPDAGRMTSYTAVTDGEGRASFVYEPYEETFYTPAADVAIRIRDESNSIVWEVNAYSDVVLRLQPKGE